MQNCIFGNSVYGGSGDGDQRGVCPHKAEVFAKTQRPRTGKEVQKVLGFVNFLWDFIPLYSCVVGLLEVAFVLVNVFANFGVP